MPHHFAFRGADEAAYVVSGWLAARPAKSWESRRLIVQNMLNTPKYTWGVQDLARSRTLLRLVRELEDDQFLGHSCRRAPAWTTSPPTPRARRRSSPRSPR